MDAIDSLLAGARHAQTVVDAAAQQLAATGLPTAGLPTAGLPTAGLPTAGLPTAPQPDAVNAAIPVAPRTHDVDGAGQLVTMTVAADVHHVTTAALRSAVSLYRDSLDLLRSKAPSDLSGLDS